MQCLSCRNDVQSKNARTVMTLYLCPSCAEMATKAEKELEVETSRALQIAKSTLAEHIMKGGLLRPGAGLIQFDEEITKELPLGPSSTKLPAIPEPRSLYCPQCGLRHIDRGDWATRPHKTHLCEGCKHVWTPFEHCTVGVT